MFCAIEFNLFLLFLIYITSLSLSLSLFLQVHGGETLETESFIHFIQAIDPKNLLLTRSNSSWRTGIKRDFKTQSTTEIRLENLNLTGIFDVNSLCKLSSLQVLSLAKNFITGTIPESISNCRSLTHLNLRDNLLQGILPMSLINMKNLTILDLSRNSFSQLSVLNFSEEFKHGHKYNMELSKLKSKLNHRKFMEKPINPLNRIADGPRSHDNQETKEHEILKTLKNWILLLLVIVLFLLFMFFMSKRVAIQVEEKKNQPSFEQTSKETSVVDVREETEPSAEWDELVSFVEESERFKIEDLLQSAAHLQNQSLCSSLYKVKLKNNSIFAVKRLKQLQVSAEQFGRAMNQIGNLKHPNISELVAYHSSNKDTLLVYRYQRNGSLLTLLQYYTEGKRDFPWRLRLSIANGIAKGLDFIHRRPYGEESIPHGNLKLSNILMTEREEPLIGEYGVQRFLELKKACINYSNGYKAPEKRITKEGDIFSFGVILLELLTGKTVEKTGLDLPKWVKFMVREEWTGEVFDKEVNKSGKQWAFPLLNVALKCVSNSPENRPNIAEVLDKIEEVLNADHENDFSFSSTSSVESNHQDGCLLHTVVPETCETPGSSNQ